MTQLTEVESKYQRFLKNFLHNSYISGLKPLLLHTPVRYAKALWLVFLLLIVAWTHIVIVNLTLEYIVQPTEIHMAPNLVHVANSPFPAVGVCSANLISKRLIQSFAEKVYRHNQSLFNANNSSDSPPSTPDVDNLARRLLVLSNFYMNAHDEPPLDVAELGQLHQLLTSYYNDSDYSVYDTLRTLAPECEDLVVRGIVYGAPVNTSQLFLKRATSTSVCCIFNYRRQSYSRNPSIRAMHDAALAALPEVVFESNSLLNSIQFVLQDSTSDDYTQTYLSNTAFRLLLFSQYDFATVQSNAYGEILVDHNTIVEIPIQPKIFDSSDAVSGVTPQTRRCYFPEEGRELLNQSYYSLDECLLLCRIDSMLQYCGCVSSPMAARSINFAHCTLLDLPCLMKWKRVWNGYTEYPYIHEEENANMNLCPHCLPTCDGVSFEIASNAAPLRKSYNASGYSKGFLNELTNDRPLSIIKLFFKLRFAQSTNMDMVGDWVVLLNRFGGILSLMYGFSIISYIEIFYYLTGKWFVYFYRALKGARETSETELQTNAIIWKELLPRTAEWSWRQEFQVQ